MPDIIAPPRKWRVTGCAEEELNCDGSARGSHAPVVWKAMTATPLPTEATWGSVPAASLLFWTGTDGSCNCQRSRWKWLTCSSLSSLCLSFHFIDFPSHHPEILIAWAQSRHQLDHPTCNSIWTWRWKKKPWRFLAPSFSLQGTLSIFLRLLKESLFNFFCRSERLDSLILKN